MTATQTAAATEQRPELRGLVWAFVRINGKEKVQFANRPATTGGNNAKE